MAHHTTQAERDASNACAKDPECSAKYQKSIDAVILTLLIVISVLISAIAFIVIRIYKKSK